MAFLDEFRITLVHELFLTPEVGEIGFAAVASVPDLADSATRNPGARD